jgi:hypothetical protein
MRQVRRVTECRRRLRDGMLLRSAGMPPHVRAALLDLLASEKGAHVLCQCVT